MSVNDEFNLGADLGLDDEKVAAVPVRVQKKNPAPVRSAPIVEEDEFEDEDPKAGWIRIVIDEVVGMSNYEVVGVNGKVYQIKRGVPVSVPPEVVGVLETALMTNTEQRKNRITGETEEVVRHFSAIPWRRA